MSKDAIRVVEEGSQLELDYINEGFMRKGIVDHNGTMFAILTKGRGGHTQTFKILKNRSDSKPKPTEYFDGDLFEI